MKRERKNADATGQVIVTTGRWDRLLDKAERPLDRLDGEGEADAALDGYAAFRWVRRAYGGRLEPVKHPDWVEIGDLLGIDRELEVLMRNTRQFLRRLPANHVLLWGERGTGKSSAVKAVFTALAGKGLRLIEVHKGDLLDLPTSGVEGDLRGGAPAARPPNVLVYATSNRRHLMPERFRDNRPRFDEDGEVHPSETAEEKVSLSDRFGVRSGFYRIDQEMYLRIVAHLAAKRRLPMEGDDLRREALRWAANASGFSGRVARQFADDLTGRLGLEGLPTP